MSVDPPITDPLDSMLDDISRTLKDNQKFLRALKDDQMADDELGAGGEVAGGEVDEYEEL